MACSGLYGLSQNCVHQQGQPVNRVGVVIAAVADIILTVVLSILVALGSKMGVSLPPTAQYMVGAMALLNMVLLLNNNIIPVTESYRPKAHLL